MATKSRDRLNEAIEQLKALNRRMMADRWAAHEREALAAEHRRLDRQSAETFARIEALFDAVFILLDKNQRLLERMPDLIAERILAPD
jgi:hypothetical protein